MDVTKINARLDELDKTIGALVPAVAQGAAVIRLIGGLVRGKMSPDQQKTFDQAIAEYDAQNAQLQSAIDRLRAASGSTSSTSSSATASSVPSSSTSTSGASSSGPSTSEG